MGAAKATDALPPVTAVDRKGQPLSDTKAVLKNLQGIIVLDVTVGRDGSVVGVRARNGPDILAQSAVNALRWWRFQPYFIDGQASVVETTVAVEFKP